MGKDRYGRGGQANIVERFKGHAVGA
jgi:hypothetical protein